MILNIIASIPPPKAGCPNPTFLGIATHWYSFLPPNPSGDCSYQLTRLIDVWLIAAAVIDMLLAIAGIVAVVFVVYGGVMYITSQGNPEQTKNAQSTIVNALIGLVIAVSAAAVISFVAGQF